MASSPFGVFGAIEHATRREVILDRLRAAVSSGALPPGTHLAEIELSESLGVSRGTLREALRHLQQEGLVVSDARNRLSVRTIDRKKVREIFAVRLALETLACEEICAFDDRSPAIAMLSAQVDRMSQQGITFAERVNEDLDFHRLLCKSSGNDTLEEAWMHIAGLTRLSITAAGPETALHNMSAERHRPIIGLLENGDVPGLREFLRAHMAHAVERIEAALS